MPQAMSLNKFNKLSLRDFENDAVISEIAESLAQRQDLIQFTINIILGKCIWQEDDALVPDKETLWDAIVRLTPLNKESVEIIIIDGGDAFYHVHENFVVRASYPGNSAIYKRSI